MTKTGTLLLACALVAHAHGAHSTPQVSFSPLLLARFFALLERGRVSKAGPKPSLARHGRGWRPPADAAVLPRAHS